METALAHQHLPTTIGGLRSKVVDVSDKLARTTARMKRFAAENEARIEGVMRGVEVVGGAAAVAYVASRWGKSGSAMQIAGFDADLVIGGLMFAGGLFELGGKYNSHLYDIGAGGLACYATRELWALGTKQQLAAPAPAAATAGVQPASAWVPRR
jgi:hypothetical protein